VLSLKPCVQCEPSVVGEAGRHLQRVLGIADRATAHCRHRRFPDLDDLGNASPPGQDATKFPQRPRVLGRQVGFLGGYILLRDGGYGASYFARNHVIQCDERQARIGTHQAKLAQCGLERWWALP